MDEEASLAEVAAALEKNRIKRVPVLSGDRVVGIVSQASLIRRLAAAQLQPVSTAAADDDDAVIRGRVLEQLRAQPWSVVGGADVTVVDGVVEFWGFSGSPQERDAERVAAETVPGVRGVADHRVPFSPSYGYL